jgi:hypothetical protein
MSAEKTVVDFLGRFLDNKQFYTFKFQVEKKNY